MSTDPAEILSPIPEDALLLHIGIHKTGTTALQSTMRIRRQLMAKHGVTYPKTTDTAHFAGRSVLNSELGWERTTSRKERDAVWRRFARQVRAIEGRVVVSAEVLCQANDAQAARVVKDLGGERVHVVMGVRALGGLLPSTWQQYLKTGRSIAYEDWLKQMLADPPDVTSTPAFWKRNDVPALIERWGGIVGPERFTLIVADPARRERVPSTFEHLLSLPSGTLTEVDEPARSNRSFTAAEAEMMRQVNEVARKQMRSVDYLQLMRDGAAVHLVEARSPAPDEPRLALPPWTAPRVAELAEQHAAAIRAFAGRGAAVVGDVDDLLKPPATADVPIPTEVPIDAAAALALGALLTASSRPSPTEAAVDNARSLRRRAVAALPTSVQARIRRLAARRA